MFWAVGSGGGHVVNGCWTASGIAIVGLIATWLQRQVDPYFTWPKSLNVADIIIYTTMGICGEVQEDTLVRGWYNFGQNTGFSFALVLSYFLLDPHFMVEALRELDGLDRSLWADEDKKRRFKKMADECAVALILCFIAIAALSMVAPLYYTVTGTRLEYALRITLNIVLPVILFVLAAFSLRRVLDLEPFMARHP